ncbi:MAG: hypothetical protein J0L55_09855 [Caulobacterales bacterium]|nr:hypothetical protein [Caulobacterales bacterium]MCA0372814.1 hypothetical protein [Pseudomonadota bacterium]
MFSERIISSKSYIRRLNQWRNLAIIGFCGLLLGICASIGQISNANGVNLPISMQFYTIFSIFSCVPSAFILAISLKNFSKLHKINVKNTQASFSK